MADHEEPQEGDLSASLISTTKNLRVTDVHQTSNIMKVFKTKDKQKVKYQDTHHQEGHDDHIQWYAMTVSCEQNVKQEPKSPKSPEPKRLRTHNNTEQRPEEEVPAVAPVNAVEEEGRGKEDIVSTVSTA